MTLAVLLASAGCSSSGAIPYDQADSLPRDLMGLACNDPFVARRDCQVDVGDGLAIGEQFCALNVEVDFDVEPDAATYAWGSCIEELACEPLGPQGCLGDETQTFCGLSDAGIPVEFSCDRPGRYGE